MSPIRKTSAILIEKPLLGTKKKLVSRCTRDGEKALSIEIIMGIE